MPIKPDNDPYLHGRVAFRQPELQPQSDSPWLRVLMIAILSGSLMFLLIQFYPVFIAPLQARLQSQLAAYWADSPAQTETETKAETEAETENDQRTTTIELPLPRPEIARDALISSPAATVTQTDTPETLTEIPPSSPATDDKQATAAPIEDSPDASVTMLSVPQPAETLLADENAVNNDGGDIFALGKNEILMQHALKQVEEDRLTSPAGNNAYEIWQTLKQENAAQAGMVMDAIADKYGEHVREQLQAGRADRAIDFYNRLQKIAPDNKQTAALNNLLINHFFQQAEQHVQKRRYTTPRGNNAYAAYQQILKLSPNNSRARQGIQKLAERYYSIALQRAKQGQYGSSLSLIERGLKLDGRNARLLALQQQIKEKRKDPLQPLLKKAARQLKAGQLTQPPGNNAYETYIALLQQAPDDSRTHQLLQQIGGHYLKQARRQHQQKNMQKSLDILNEGLALIPNHAGMRQLRQNILENWQ